MKTIMLIEDNDTLANAIVSHFGKNDIEVIWAKDSDEVFQKINSGPQVILLDIYLPKPHNGLDILKLLKSDSMYQSIPVMMLTNINEPSVEDKARDLGAVDYVVKSNSSLEEILEKVNEVLEIKEDADLIIKKTRAPKK